MRVALVNPPWQRPGHYGVRAGSRWPHFESSGARYMPYPFYLGYAAALLLGDGFEVALFDGCATRETDEAFLRRVGAFGPQIVVQENATASIDVDLRWAQTFKRDFSAFVLMTGHHAERLEAELERLSAIDALAGGEWEYTVLEAAQRLRAGRDLAGVHGLAYRAAEGVRVEPRRGNVHDLDGLPFPLRAGYLDMSCYHDNPGDIPSPSLQLHGSRGCPYQCNFCVWPQVVYKDHNYRVRSPKSIVDEIEHEFRHSDAGYRSYYFDDDTFNIGNQRLQALADEIVMRGLEHIPWGAMCRADTSSKETLVKLRRAGLAAVKYGVESGSEKLLFDNGKRLKIATVREMVRFAHSLGLKTHLTFSFGLIGETRETMRETLDLALELDPHTLQFSISTPFPGTAFHKYATEHNLLLTDEPSAYDGMSSCVVRTDHLAPEELEHWLTHAYDTWNRHVARRTGIWRRAMADPLGAARLAVRNPHRVAQHAIGLAQRALSTVWP